MRSASCGKGNGIQGMQVDSGQSESESDMPGAGGQPEPGEDMPAAVGVRDRCVRSGRSLCGEKERDEQAENLDLGVA